MSVQAWETLSTTDQRALLKMPDADLAKRFGKDLSFFKRARQFFERAPEQTVAPTPKPHTPPKDLVVSARRDLSFFEANFELFDNSIDRWRRGGATKGLHITVEYDLDLLTGRYTDDAGGLEETDVYKIFIPGETANRHYSQPMIGSFGMGAKKGIFRLTDGAKVVSGCSPKFSATSEVPEKWETNPSWETLDGRAKAISPGTTEIYFYKLFDRPTPDELTELVQKAGVVYRPLLSGELLGKKIHFKINGVDVEPCRDINWSSPKGAEPAVYKFSQTFANFLNTGNDITLDFVFKCGLTRKLPGMSGDAEPNWGVDVYGNGRLIQQYLKEEFGFTTENKLSTQRAGSKFFRGQLFINGHSFAIPWDTHKREYLRDHPVSRWLRWPVLPVIRPFVTIAGRFSGKGQTDLRTTVLQATSPKSEPHVFALPLDSSPPKSMLPKWEYGPTTKDSTEATEKPSSVAVIDEEEQSEAQLAATEEEDRTITVTLDAAERDELLERFGVASDDELASVVRDCLTGGVAFPLSPDELARALKVFKCDGNVGRLSGRIKEQLLKKLTS